MENNEIKKETRSVKSAALEADEILRRAHEEAEKIVSAAKQQANAPQKCVPITQNANVPEEEIELFADSGNYSEPLAVKWSGRQFLIPRGVRVRVPSPVAQIIRISQAQDHKAAALIRRLEQAAPKM